MMLADLLNAILDLKVYDRIKHLTYKNPFNLQEIPTEKLTVMDLKVETEKGEMIDIEMQMGEDDYFKRRSLYYWASLYTDVLKSGKSYSGLKKCIVISIVDFKCIGSRNYHTKFKVKEDTENFLLSDDLEVHFIELPGFDDNRNIEELNDIEEWVMFFKDYDDERNRAKMEALIERKEVIRMAAEYVEKANQDEYIRERLIAIEKYQMDVNTRIEIAKSEGKAESKAEGKAEGHMEAQMNIARNLLDILDDLTISNKTGLSIEQVRMLRQE